ncbi:uncharacterized protein LOC124359041 [Homalodisca vitripennis]|uniref:uncharacterized protein LOC124359041 n=1 Tax=Homalodisca vitripennis TaxID=197043 RepID=UPI001EEC00AD|nr:uncharacterized protein LOC124359041 [Homalodisca vitripennis]
MAAITLKYFMSLNSSFTPSFKKTNFKSNPLLLQVICIMGYAVFRTVVLNLYSFIYRTKKTLSCLNLAVKLLSKVEGNINKSVFWMVLLVYVLLFTGSFGILARCFGTVAFLEAAPFVSNNLQEIAIICLLVTMLTIIAISLEDINSALEALDHRCVDASPRLQRLMNRHWESCNLLDSLSQCFGLDVVLQCWYNLNKIVLLTYYSYFMFVTKFRVYTDHLSTLIDVPYRFFVVWYLGSKCDWISYQTEESRRLLAELLIHHNDKLDETCKTMINVFLLRLRSRSAQFSACGLFILDRAKFYGMLQMAVTYIVVLVQFHSFM